MSVARRHSILRQPQRSHAANCGGGRRFRIAANGVDRIGGELTPRAGRESDFAKRTHAQITKSASRQCRTLQLSSISQIVRSRSKRSSQPDTRYLAASSASEQRQERLSHPLSHFKIARAEAQRIVAEKRTECMPSALGWFEESFAADHSQDAYVDFDRKCARILDNVKRGRTVRLTNQFEDGRVVTTFKPNKGQDTNNCRVSVRITALRGNRNGDQRQERPFRQPNRCRRRYRRGFCSNS